jgi:hypothetical protein
MVLDCPVAQQRNKGRKKKMEVLGLHFVICYLSLLHLVSRHMAARQPDVKILIARSNRPNGAAAYC